MKLFLLKCLILLSFDQRLFTSSFLVNEWKPMTHWRQRENHNNNRRSFASANLTPPNTSNEYRIEWFRKLCRSTRKFCSEVSQAKGTALKEYRRKMTKFQRYKKFHDGVLQNIRKKNPHLNDTLAIHLKKYVLHRLNIDVGRNHLQ